MKKKEKELLEAGDKLFSALQKVLSSVPKDTQVSMDVAFEVVGAKEIWTKATPHSYRQKV